jgi:cell division protein FtsI/penicillin-binding protein 2
MDRMRRYLEAFGLLDQSGVGLPMDPRGRLGFGAEAMAGGIAKTSRVAFGQSVMVTPLGMAMAYAAIANHGVLMKPRLVSAYYDGNGRLVKRFAPETVRQVIEPQTADYLAGLLQGVVEKGTGKAAAVPGYTVAGKTGTAQKVVPGQHGYAHGKYVASFIGSMPVKDPKALIYVVVDEPKGAYYGAQVAAPVFQAVGQRLLWYWKIPPDDPASLDKSRSRLARE